ncbi:MAG: putative oxidoreductase C-terminal domain-containing protein [Gemmataceae bacterium]
MSLRFITLHPGHFHAALVHKEMYSGVDPRVHVYAPLGPGLLAHLEKLAQFNTRADNPTRWEVEVHADPDFLHRLAREKPGDIVVLAGHNATKLQAIETAVGAGLHVLADKPWILRPEQLPRLAEVLDEADRQGLIAYDIMTERYEITSILQRALVADEEIFGAPLPGSAASPCVTMESVHFLKKNVAGAPLRRPAVFFDVEQQGEGLGDVGTHLVDLIPWMLFPGRALDAESAIRVHSARRWPTPVGVDDYRAITGERDFPTWLLPQVAHDQLEYYCNTQVVYQVGSVWARLDVLWGMEAQKGGGDTHHAVFRGSQSSVEVRQGAAENYRPEVYVVPQAGTLEGLKTALARRLEALAGAYPALGIEKRYDSLRVTIPEAYRSGHEAHFGAVTRQFLRYVAAEEKMPAWEKANMLAKYRVTTDGVALARRQPR